MVQLREQLAIEPMREADVGIVQEIERRIFATPWPRNAYHRELSARNSSYYVVLRRPSGTEPGRIVGYAGMWRMHDEAHVTTIGVRQDFQGLGYGRVLFVALMQAACAMGARWITLEVRASNEAAIHMYEGFAFRVIGRRRGYYTDNGEDALVMWSDSVRSSRFRSALERNLARIDSDVRGLARDLPNV
jgi:[ribosomal protein S18]-alanine N-acetyltransferase